MAYYPWMANSTEIKEYYELLRKRVITVLDGVLGIADVDGKIAMIDQEMITFSPPNDFTGPNSVEIQVEKQFQASCLTLSKMFKLDAIKMTTMQYYAALERAREQQKKKSYVKV